jgi:hypothetical protein
VPNSLPADFADGVLPPGDYPMTLSELEQSLLVVGPRPNLPNWDTTWRRYLVGQLTILAAQLWDEGVTEIYLDGSFVEDKLGPGDIDGYYVTTQSAIAGGRLGRLNAQSPPYLDDE